MERFLITICLSLFMSLASFAQSQNVSELKTILILNSYSENSPWSKFVLNPVTYYTAQKDDLHVEMLNLNSTLITDSTTYNKVRENVLKSYRNRNIDYVVFIGNLAFTMRDEICQMWGKNIPMLLITRDLTLADDEYYYSGFNYDDASDATQTIEDIRNDYNFTAVYIPDLYRETVDLMVKLIPDMQEFVYFSDAIYFNRHLAWEIENYLMSEYPHITFKWAQASFDNSEELQYYLVNRKPNDGLLLSSWSYEQMGALGYPTLVTGDIDLLFSSSNPVFSLRESYMSMGSIGGVYSDKETVSKSITSAMDAMTSAIDLRTINFFNNRTPFAPVINYPLMTEYKLAAKNCPDNTVFRDKPLTLWEKYHWYVIIAMVLVAAVIVLLTRRNVTQQHEIEMLSRHKQFVENMPIPYSKAQVIYDEYTNLIVDIKYTLSNEAFKEVLRENADPSNPQILFTAQLIAEKTSELLSTGQPISFLHHFDRTDKYYVITLCLVGYKKRKDRDIIDTIDIFAINVTQRQKAERDLKDITKRLDMTINVANIIPWDWDMKTDIMTFDAYSLFQRVSRTFEEGLVDQTSRITVGEYMRLIHPEDREKIRSLREKLYLNEVSKFQMQYRVIIARQNHDVVEWVEIRGEVIKRDDKGLPIYVMGSMALITDRKQQEADMLEARRQTIEAQGIKSSFIANLSHEVRIQLNAIVGFASLMSDTDDAERRKEFAEIINVNNQQLLDYIDNLADESKNADASIKIKTDDRGEGHESYVSEFKTVSTKAPVEIKTTPNNKPLTQVAPPAPKPTPSASENDDVQHGFANPLPSTPQGRSNRKLILVAEDIEGNYLLLKHFIPKNYDIIHAWTGQEAVDLFNKRHPDLILMDIGMPVMDGYKATAEIRKYDRDVPIVAVTAFTYASDRELILSSGFDDYIAKPVAREILLDVIKRYLA